MNELERLKADLEVLDRYHVSPDITRHVKESIVRAEDAADPWRDVKEKIVLHRMTTDTPTVRLIAYIDHLKAEIARLTARVAELEAEAKAEDDEDIHDAEKVLADMIPPFEGPIESIEPILDPARVLATAIEVLKTIDEPDMFYASNLAKAYQCLHRHSSKAEPYKLKGGEE